MIKCLVTRATSAGRRPSIPRRSVGTRAVVVCGDNSVGLACGIAMGRMCGQRCWIRSGHVLPAVASAIAVTAGGEMAAVLLGFSFIWPSSTVMIMSRSTWRAYRSSCRRQSRGEGSLELNQAESHETSLLFVPALDACFLEFTGSTAIVS